MSFLPMILGGGTEVTVTKVTSNSASSPYTFEDDWDNVIVVYASSASSYNAGNSIKLNDVSQTHLWSEGATSSGNKTVCATARLSSVKKGDVLKYYTATQGSLSSRKLLLVMWNN